MNIVIRTQGTMAIYEQIVMQLKNAIVSGELAANEALPSIRGLASELEVSVITTKRAYEELEKAGIVGPVDGSKPRQVLCSSELELEEIFTRLGI